MKIFMWGCGIIAKDFINKEVPLESIEAFIDNNENNNEFMGKRVVRPNFLKDCDYDAVIVGTKYSEEIYKQSADLGLDLQKFIFTYENIGIKDFNQNYELAEKVMGTAFVKRTKANGNHKIALLSGFNDKKDGTVNLNNFTGDKHCGYDVVRLKTFEMVANEIIQGGVQGETAELGVYQGEFAKYINYAFPDRKLYLFDTFEGFNQDEVIAEFEKGHCDKRFINEFKNTTEELVLEKMTNKDNVIIKKGFFPQSLEGLEDRFAFVSLDADLENSILEGLRYFYPRLEAGGYIFVHDYNSSLRGVSIAIQRYEAEIGHKLHKCPIADACGTLAIIK